MVINPGREQQRQRRIQRQEVDGSFPRRQRKENEHDQKPRLEKQPIIVAACAPLKHVPKHERQKKTPRQSQTEKIGKVIINWMAVPGTAEKALEVFLKQLAIDESFAAPGKRHPVPSDREEES